MKDFGARLKEERGRLGLSSANFAESCGVGRTAQFNYERGEREPDSGYLAAATELGVDVGYVLSGKRLAQRQKDSLEDDLNEFGRAFAAILGISDEDMIQASELVESRMKEHNAALERSAMVNFPKWRVAARAEHLKASVPLVENCPKLRELINNQLDMTVLADAIEQVESILPKDTVIAPAKKASIIAMLCRASKASGTVDPAIVKEAVNLVIG